MESSNWTGRNLSSDKSENNLAGVDPDSSSPADKKKTTTISLTPEENDDGEYLAVSPATDEQTVDRLSWQSRKQEQQHSLTRFSRGSEESPGSSFSSHHQKSDRSLIVSSSLTQSSPNKSGSSSFPESSDTVHHMGGLVRGASMASLEPTGRFSSHNNLQDFTIHKFRWDRLRIEGRDEELQILQDQWQEVATGVVPRRITWITGQSGTGKSHLARVFAKQPRPQQFPKKQTSNMRSSMSMERRPNLFVSGKYDLQAPQPYKGIISCCSELCGALVANDEENSDSVIHTLRTELGDEWALLVRFIPALGEVMDGHGPNTNASSISHNDPQEDAVSSEFSRNQFHFAMMRFWRVLTKHFAPLVVILDDLQWADAASLELLQVLLLDQSNNAGLMILGLYRSNEVQEGQILHQVLRTMRDQCVQPGTYFMSSIELGNLDINAIHRIVNVILDSNNFDGKNLALAELCLRKTQGLAFFVIQWLKMLYEKKLVRFVFGALMWSFDIKEVESGTSVSDNVLDLLTAKMNHLDNTLLRLLQIAACLGNRFSERMLRVAWDAAKDEQTMHHNQDHEFRPEQLIVEGFIIKIGDGDAFSWEHDKIHEAARALLSERQRADVCERIGQALLRLDSHDMGAPSTLFVVARLLNESAAFKQGSALTIYRRIELARLNEQACREAIAFSAFTSAANYATRGITLLPVDAWQREYNLTLSLYSNGAMAESAVGNQRGMEKLCQAVLIREDVPLDDKFAVYNTWIDSLVSSSAILEGKNMLLTLLEMLGMKFRQNALFVESTKLSNIFRIKATLRSFDVSKLSEASDPRVYETSKLLDKLLRGMFYTADKRFSSVIFKNLNVTLNHGYCAFSPIAFASAGIILTGIVNDLQGGSKCGEIALALLEKGNYPSTKARTIMFVHTFLYPWTHHSKNILRPLLHAYNTGLQTGDIESACVSITIWIYTRFRMGESLNQLISDCSKFSKQMRDLKRYQALVLNLLAHQTFLNLSGDDNADDDISELVGQVFTENDYKLACQNPLYQFVERRQRAMILTFAGRHVECADLILKHGWDECEKKTIAIHLNMYSTFLRGVSCLAAFRLTKNRKYLKVGKTIHNRVKSWVRMGNPNVQHTCILLEAELSACQGKVRHSVKLYEQCIIQAKRGGYLHDAALASERLADLQWHKLGDLDEALYRLKEAVTYYTDWGAHGKVALLNETYSDLLQSTPREVSFMQRGFA